MEIEKILTALGNTGWYENTALRDMRDAGASYGTWHFT